MNMNWTIDSWRRYAIKQQPQYLDQAKLQQIETMLAAMPPLVSPSEILSLTKDLRQVALGKAFLLQGGDCAESFAEFSHHNLHSFFKLMLQMTVALMYGAGKPIIKIGRIAGQFAKPRSEDLETRNGETMPSYRGDIINDSAWNQEARVADPERMMRVYNQSAITLNYLRSLAIGGDAKLTNVVRWNEEFLHGMKDNPLAEEFASMTNGVARGVAFTEACGLSSESLSELSSAKFYSSHEALLLNYEQAFTREFNNCHYDLSAHFLWIGERTRAINEAHVEFMRGISNPIGCKIGPSATPDDLVRLIRTLNPKNQDGRLTLIIRMGKEKIAELLPSLMRRVKSEGLSAIWSSDPMHGNTIKSSSGYKTRKLDDVLSEVRSFFKIAEAEAVVAGGIHLEMTGQDVTECLGGTQAISDDSLSDRYRTACDPRLNASQSLELAFLIAEKIK